MRVRICPYCDHEMKRRYRCDTCGAFVWNANFLDVPKTDDDPMMDMTRFGRAPEPVKKAYKEVYRPDVQFEQKYPYTSTAPKQKKVKKISFGGIFAGVMVFLVILVISAAVLILSNEKGMLSEYFTHGSSSGSPVETAETKHRDIFGGSTEESAGGLDYPAPEGSEYITQEAADATGKACNSRAHFDIKRSELEEVISRYLDKSGLEYELYEFEAQNFQSTEDINDLGGRMTYFKGDSTFYVGSGSHVLYYDIQFDSVTEQVHELNVSILGRDEDCVDVFAQCLNWLSGSEFGSGHLKQIKKYLKEASDGDFYSLGSYDVFVGKGDYEGEPNYYISIAPLQL